MSEKTLIQNDSRSRSRVSENLRRCLGLVERLQQEIAAEEDTESALDLSPSKSGSLQNTNSHKEEEVKTEDESRNELAEISESVDKRCQGEEKMERSEPEDIEKGPVLAANEEIIIPSNDTSTLVINPPFQSRSNHSVENTEQPVDKSLSNFLEKSKVNSVVTSDEDRDEAKSVTSKQSIASRLSKAFSVSSKKSISSKKSNTSPEKQRSKLSMDAYKIFGEPVSPVAAEVPADDHQLEAKTTALTDNALSDEKIKGDEHDPVQTFEKETNGDIEKETLNPKEQKDKSEEKKTRKKTIMRTFSFSRKTKSLRNVFKGKEKDPKEEIMSPQLVHAEAESEMHNGSPVEESTDCGPDRNEREPVVVVNDAAELADKELIEQREAAAPPQIIDKLESVVPVDCLSHVEKTVSPHLKTEDDSDDLSQEDSKESPVVNRKSNSTLDARQAPRPHDNPVDDLLARLPGSSDEEDEVHYPEQPKLSTILPEKSLEEDLNNKQQEGVPSQSNESLKAHSTEETPSEDKSASDRDEYLLNSLKSTLFPVETIEETQKLIEAKYARLESMMEVTRTSTSASTAKIIDLTRMWHSDPTILAKDKNGGIKESGTDQNETATQALIAINDHARSLPVQILRHSFHDENASTPTPEEAELVEKLNRRLRMLEEVDENPKGTDERVEEDDAAKEEPVHHTENEIQLQENLAETHDSPQIDEGEHKDALVPIPQDEAKLTKKEKKEQERLARKEKREQKRKENKEKRARKLEKRLAKILRHRSLFLQAQRQQQGPEPELRQDDQGEPGNKVAGNTRLLRELPATNMPGAAQKVLEEDEGRKVEVERGEDNPAIADDQESLVDQLSQDDDDDDGDDDDDDDDDVTGLASADGSIVVIPAADSIPEYVDNKTAKEKNKKKPKKRKVKKMLSWSEDVIDNEGDRAYKAKAPVENENTAVAAAANIAEATIWWSNSKEAVEVLYENEEEEEEEDPYQEVNHYEDHDDYSNDDYTVDSEAQYSMGDDTYASYRTDDTFGSVDRHINFSFSSIKQVTSAIAEEAVYVKNEIAEVSKEYATDVKEMASNMIKGLFGGKRKQLKSKNNKKKKKFSSNKADKTTKRKDWNKEKKSRP